ncbi:hypothetical protein HYALB_00013908, partial [Hymenoscyphus albidus]
MADKPPTIFKTPSGATFVSRFDIDELQKHGAEFTEAVRIEKHKAWEKEVDVLDMNEWSRKASAVDQLCASEKAQFDRLREELDQRCTIFRIYNNTSDPWRGFEHLIVQVKHMQEAREREKKTMKEELSALNNLTYSQQVTAKDSEAQLELFRIQSETCKHEKEKAVSGLENFKESHNKKVRDLEKKAQSLERQLEKNTEENSAKVEGLEAELKKSEGRSRDLEYDQLGMQRAHDEEMLRTLQKLQAEKEQALEIAESKHNNEYS